MPPVDIGFEEFCKTAIESAQKGFYLQSSQVDQALADFLRQYDWVVALWPEARNLSRMGASIVRDSGKTTGFSRCNSIPCADRETALKLHALCRGADNYAPDPPPDASENQPANSSEAGLLFAKQPIGPGTRH